jgi:phage-related protein
MMGWLATRMARERVQEITTLIERHFKEDAGFVRCEVWVKPEHVAEVRAYADSLTAQQSVATITSTHRQT